MRVPFPVTLVVLVVTAVVSVAALVDTHLSLLLIRDEPLVRAGQWWRLVTPVLVQPSGWGQFAFNLLGIAVVGTAFEQRRPRWQWVATYLAAGVGSLVLLTVLRPDDHGGGASDCVAGLIGALSVVRVLDRRPRPIPSRALDIMSTGYSAFFCAYLALLDLGGVWPAIAGDVAVALSLTARHRFGAAQTSTGILVLVAIAGIAMAVRLDGHGIGLLTGVILAGAIGRPGRQVPSAP